MTIIDWIQDRIVRPGPEPRETPSPLALGSGSRPDRRQTGVYDMAADPRHEVWFEVIRLPEGAVVETTEHDAHTVTRRVVPAGTTLFVHYGAPGDLSWAERMLEALARLGPAVRADMATTRIDRLVAALLVQEPLSPADEAIELDNAALRARYLETVPSWTAADLHRLAGSPARRPRTAARSPPAGRRKAASSPSPMPGPTASRPFGSPRASRGR